MDEPHRTTASAAAEAWRDGEMEGKVNTAESYANKKHL